MSAYKKKCRGYQNVKVIYDSVSFFSHFIKLKYNQSHTTMSQAITETTQTPTDRDFTKTPADTLLCLIQ